MGELVYDGKMWLLGGFGQGKPIRLNQVWCSSDGKDWTQVTGAAPWGIRNLPCTVVFDSKMWIMAGAEYSGPPDKRNPILHSDVWYSSDGQNWTAATESAPWGRRTGAVAVAYKGKIWLMGGGL